MSAAKHTAGPWFAHPSFFRDHGGRKPIFTDGLWTIKSDPELNALAVVDWADDHDPETRVEAEANALLIAAAPDFYREATRLIEAWDARTTVAQQIITGKSDRELQQQALDAIEGLRTALAKAQSGEA